MSAGHHARKQAVTDFRFEAKIRCNVIGAFVGVLRPGRLEHAFCAFQVASMHESKLQRIFALKRKSVATWQVHVFGRFQRAGMHESKL